MPQVLAVGARSLLRRAAAAVSADVAAWRVAAHDAVRPEHFDDVGCVVNFAFAPRPGRERHGPASDFDLALARMAHGRGAHYVMLSSRLVYGQSGRLGIPETAPLSPANPYAMEKAESERALRGLLGERLTVLRLGNIIAYEAEPGRATFMGLLLNRLLQEGRMRFDMSPFVRRDFLPVEHFARLLARLAAAPRPGTFNVGSGLATAVGNIAEWVAEGFGRGELLVTDFRRFDQFSLDIGAAAGAFGLACGEDELRTACVRVGARLARGGALS